MAWLFILPGAIAFFFAFAPLFSAEGRDDFKRNMKEFLPFTGIAWVVLVLCLWAAIYVGF